MMRNSVATTQIAKVAGVIMNERENSSPKVGHVLKN
jgi:hypothetical protein